MARTKKEKTIANKNLIRENQPKIEECIRTLLGLLGDNPDRPGLKETPKRVAKMYTEILDGQLYTNQEIGQMFAKNFDVDTHNLVVVKDITFYSLCEHHIVPFFGKAYIGYIPNGKVIGLSKLARITQMCAKRLQLQEKLGDDIAQAVMAATGAKDVAVVLKDTKHLCVSMRGVKDDTFDTTTAALYGRFVTKKALRDEFYNIIKK